jgi:tripartite-type tricarboxylate transporter receptor subunit TctC
MKARQSLAFAAIASLALLAGHGSALAQAYPNKVIKLQVPFATGGTTDIVARVISEPLGKALGQTVLIENKAGGGGVVGANETAKSVPDGYSLGMATVSTTAANPAINPKMPYNALTDFTSIINIAATPNIIAVHPSFPARNYKEFLAELKKSPGKYSYASSGTGGIGHLQTELFKNLTGTFIAHIPYRGAGPALQDLIAGQVDMMFDGLGSSAAHIKGGRIKALMVSGTKRNPAFPDVPCSTELGLPDYTVSTWYGLWAPKGTPADIQARAVEEIRRACQTDEAKTTWANQGADFPNLAAAQFDGFIKSELAKWSKVVKASGAKLD